MVDPHRTRTARAADRHVAPRPGTDAALLFAMVHVLFAEDLADPGELAAHLAGVDEVRALAADFAPERVTGYCDVPAAEIRTLARELAAARRAVVYGRLGSTAVEFGTLASWLVDVLNALTGNLDRPGGAMFPLSATARAPRPPRRGKGFRTGRWHSRVSGHPEVKSELPTASLAAAREAGANVNQLLHGSRLDPLSGTAVLNGFPVRITPATDGTPGARPLATQN